MRNIEFRAWDPDVKCWIKEELLINSEGEFCLDTSRKHPNYHIISQYTGLKDKNETKIYEGDIVRFKDIDNNIRDLEILFGNPLYGAVFRDTDLDGHIRRWSPNYLSSIEVVGNIYENGELLK